VTATTGAPRRKGEQTRALIVDTALRMFRERGYDETTMRAIAAEAGVSVGNAYHYFESKEHLIQAFYDQIRSEHAAACTDVLATETDFAARLRGVLLAWHGVSEPYHGFAAKFFKVAAEPTSPLSPFSEASRSSRHAGMELFRQTLDGSDAKADRVIAADLPELLWLYHMGIVLFWVHDASAQAARTVALIEHTVPLVVRLVAVSRLPVIRSVARDAVSLVHRLR
jgi:AcrR family transcriptional regulator